MSNRHTTDSTHFFLVGNGSYQNRGCEAIIRGTMEILRHEFGQAVRARAGVFAKPEIVREQVATEIDPAVASFPLPLPGGPRWSRGWFVAQANQRLGTAFYPHVKALTEPAQSASVALEVGGDHYSLDYGKPDNFMAMDRFLKARGVPVVLWGASVGPFDNDPAFAPRMFDHLRGLAAIFVRESDSFDYLQANGVSDNLHLMADPAFVMESVAPPAAKIGFTLPDGAIGINFSPMVAFYRGQHPADVDLKEWLAFCVELVKSLAALERPVLLIPHVGSPDPGNDDFAFLHALCQTVAHEVSVPVKVLPRGLNAAELKWIIGKCAVFAGARTHSTIAAISSHVPTLSIGYSLKARGINRDVYGHLDHCLPVSDLNTADFTERLRVLLVKETAIRTLFATRVPEIQAKALSAGAVLRKLVAGPPCA
jgi:colanic acid/amylovoran biosynthesis protein